MLTLKKNKKYIKSTTLTLHPKELEKRRIKSKLVEEGNNK